MENNFTDQEQSRRNKLTQLVNEGNDPFKYERFERNFTSSSFKEKYKNNSKEELHECTDEIKIAGRIMAIRQTFAVLKDFDGTVQLYINKKTCDPKIWHLFSKVLDIGDIVGVQGTPMKTNTGECTVKINNLVILSKSLRPLPEKFHGLQDEEVRARKRYVDLIMNSESMNTFVLRSKIVSLIREYLNSLGYIEVETPILQSILGGAAARPFVTHHNALDREYYLRIATELALKKLVVGGFEKVYEIGRNFRNEGMDATHNPEFTSIEAYTAYSSMEDQMDLLEEIIKYVTKNIGKQNFEYKGVNLDFNQKFKRINMVDAIKEATNIDFNQIDSDAKAIEIANEKHIELLPHEKNRGHIINKFFETYCEERCIQPTFVYGHPIEVSPLAKKDSNDPRYTKRFELFICGKEYANAFSELNDPIDQKQRFENQLKEKDLGNDEANEMDNDFIEALEYGLPPTGGFGLGIDRLVMLLTNNTTIRNVLLFPHMRDEK